MSQKCSFLISNIVGITDVWIRKLEEHMISRK